MILVTGATASVGRQLVRELAALGAPTRALIHESHEPLPLHDLAIETSVGRFEDAQSLRAAPESLVARWRLHPSAPFT